MRRLFAVSLLLVTFMIAAPAEATIPASQRAALEALYNSTNGTGWVNNEGWLGESGTECSWFGVYCDSQLATVVAIDMPQNNLSGPIPSQIGQLVDVDYIGFWENNLTGPIPIELTALTKLQYLYLEENMLTGTIPPGLGGLSQLVDLRIWQNQLTGGIPSELGNLSNLEILSISINQLSGPVPSSLGNLSRLEFLALNQNQLTGGIPESFRSLTALSVISLHTNNLTGSIPTWIGELTRLTDLRLSFNQLSGPIPESIGNLTSLEILYLGNNKLSGTLPTSLTNLTSIVDLEVWDTDVSGPIPTGFGSLQRLEYLILRTNKLSGGIPADLGNAPVMRYLYLFGNSLSGSIPSEIGNIQSLESLSLRDNDLEGSIPSSFGNLSQLNLMRVDGNRLTGGIPAEIGNLSRLEILLVSRNALTGPVPESLMGLTALQDGQNDFGYNGLYTNDSTFEAFLDRKQAGGSFAATQTVAPTNAAFAAATEDSVTISWTPIAFTSGPGGYRIKVAPSPNGPFTDVTTTANKAASSARVGGLAPMTSYSFQIDTISYASGDQKNDVTSSTSAGVTGTTAASEARVTVTSSPAVLTAVADGVSVDSGSFAIANLGQQSTTVTLAPSDGFFSLSTTSVSLGGGQSARIQIDSVPQSSAGDFRGTVLLSGTGVPSGAGVRVTLFATPPPPAGNPMVVVETTRVDVSGPVGSSPTGTVTFRNIGTGTATGLLGADVPWIVPEPSIVSIEPGATHTFSFTIDRSSRPDAAALAGTQAGNLSFVYVAGSNSLSFGRDPFAGAPTLATPVGVSDTVKPTVETVAGIPLLKEGEIGFVIPGVGNVTGSVGVFISDLTIANGVSGLTIGDLALHYISGGTTLSASQPVSSGQSLALADVVATVFDKTEQIGALHVRSSKALELAMNANVFNKSNTAGTYGTAIPVFRTDRSAASGESLLITGLRKSETSHTNLYLQETNGSATNVHIDLLDTSGAVVGALDQGVAAFGTTIVGQQFIPDGAVTARVSNETAGGIVSYATPVDRASGDTWALTDWGRVFAIGAGDRQIIPVAGSAPGRNNTYFRTDVAVTNGGELTSVTIRYYQQVPAVSVIEKEISLASGETLEYDDVVAGLFAATPPSLGHVELDPGNGALVMTSRTYTTVSGSAQTFGTGVPTLAPSSGLRAGQTVVIGGLEDSTAATTNAGTPATFRTNVGLVEVDGAAVTVKVSVLLFDGKQLAAGGSTGSRTYLLSPREFKQLNAIVSEILGAEIRENEFGELRNVQVRVDVTGGDGAVVVYATQTDNGTGDTVLRVQ